MSNNIPTISCFKKGHIRSRESRVKQSETMKNKFKSGELKTNQEFINYSKLIKPKPHKPKNCEKCGILFYLDSARQKWCKVCAPDKSSRRILQRYNLSAPEHKNFLETNKGKCFICNFKKATCVDHCHNTGKIRGLLCHKCNNGLAHIEDKNYVLKANKYLEFYHGSIS